MMRSALIATTLLVGLLLLAIRLDPVREGLNATYYADRDWSLSSIVATPRERPSTARLFQAWQGAPPEVFSASWAGSFLAFRDGVYTFSTVSDDGSWVYVDGKLVVDNGGRHGPVEARGTMPLRRGVHAIRIQYVQEGGGVQLDLRWGRDGQSLEPVPDWALTPRATTYWRLVLSAALRRVLAAVEWLWAGVLLVGAATAVWPWTSRAKRWLEHERAWPAMALIVAGSLVLNLTGLWWGLPGGSWAPDEVVPWVVLDGASRHFSHGWSTGYLPFHHYVLTAAFSPMLLLDWLGRVDLNTPGAYAILALIGRLVTVAAGVGTLLAVYACGARTFGSRAGLLAAAMLATVTPFVYYAKTSNVDVPSLFWFSLSLLFYLRALDRPRLIDVVGFAVCGMLSILTKDPAYGLYLLPPFAIIFRIWRLNRDAGIPHPLMRAVLDRRLAIAALAAGVLFVACANLVFNWPGFMDHVRFVTGGGSQNYRAFEPTIAGRAALFWTTLDLIRVAWGWPLFLISVAGVAVAALTRSDRRPALWLAVPVVSYYIGFINFVLFSYDRFLLPLVLVLSLFGGLALDRWLTATSRARAWSLVGMSAVFAYTLLYAAMVDYVMIRDSRYTVERWLAAHVGRHELVGWVFPLQYYPRLEAFDNTEITSVEELQREQPVYYVLNADYARAEPPDTAIGRLIAGLQGASVGYDLVFRFRQPSPWPWLPGAHRDVVGPHTERMVTSSLRHINPSYEVFKRQIVR